MLATISDKTFDTFSDFLRPGKKKSCDYMPCHISGSWCSIYWVDRMRTKMCWSRTALQILHKLHMWIAILRTLLYWGATGERVWGDYRLFYFPFDYLDKWESKVITWKFEKSSNFLFSSQIFFPTKFASPPRTMYFCFASRQIIIKKYFAS